jgi:hypothetical protein
VLVVALLMVVGAMPVWASVPSETTASETNGDKHLELADPCAELGDHPTTGLEATLTAALCASQGVEPEPKPTPASCEGSVLCMATEAEAAEAGIDTATLRKEAEEVLASLGAASRVDAASSTEALGAVLAATGYDAGWIDFYLYYNSHCSGTLQYHSYCGWLNHTYMDCQGYMYTTSYPARSGNNRPADDWVSSVGPIPNNHQPINGGTVTNKFTWGFRFGTYAGYISDSGSSFYPGKWYLDPWYVNKPGTDLSVYERREFEIHGGSGSHEFWGTYAYTQGCIRLQQASINGLKGLWNDHTDNRTIGAYPFVDY